MSGNLLNGITSRERRVTNDDAANPRPTLTIGQPRTTVATGSVPGGPRSVAQGTPTVSGVSSRDHIAWAASEALPQTSEHAEPCGAPLAGLLPCPAPRGGRLEGLGKLVSLASFRPSRLLSAPLAPPVAARVSDRRRAAADLHSTTRRGSAPTPKAPAPRTRRRTCWPSRDKRSSTSPRGCTTGYCAFLTVRGPEGRGSCPRVGAPPGCGRPRFDPSTVLGVVLSCVEGRHRSARPEPAEGRDRPAHLALTRAGAHGPRRGSGAATGSPAPGRNN